MTRRRIIVVSLMIGVLTVISIFVASLGLYPILKMGMNHFLLSFMDSEPAVTPREVHAMKSLGIEWQHPIISRWSWIMDDPDGAGIFMVIDDNQVILPVWNIDSAFKSSISLNSYELETGEIQWQSELDIDSTFSIGKNSNTIFVSATDVDKTRSYCDPDVSCSVFRITAYDMLSGKIVWLFYPEELFNNERGLFVEINDERIYLDSKDSNNSALDTVCLDTVSGGQKSDCEAFDSLSSNYDLDIRSLPENFEYEPQEIVSNFALNNELLFFLTASDNILWAIDKDSFEVVGWVKFVGAPLKKGTSYRIVANEDKVIIYMTDSHQLIAFDLQIPD